MISDQRGEGQGRTGARIDEEDGGSRPARPRLRLISTMTLTADHLQGEGWGIWRIVASAATDMDDFGSLLARPGPRLTDCVCCLQRGQWPTRGRGQTMERGLHGQRRGPKRGSRADAFGDELKLQTAAARGASTMPNPQIWLTPKDVLHSKEVDFRKRTTIEKEQHPYILLNTCTCS